MLAPSGKLQLCERLGHILDGLEALIARTRPMEVAVESAFFGLSARSALTLGQARGVALAAAARAGLPVFEYAPSEVKLAFAGNGRAEKAQMVRMAQTILGVGAELSDEADALAVAVCHLARRAGMQRLNAAEDRFASLSAHPERRAEGPESKDAQGERTPNNEPARSAASRLRPSVRRPGGAA